MRITENSKYVVKDRATGKAITNGASRTTALSLVARLGDRRRGQNASESGDS